jgi:hypothetical protein
MRTKMLIICLLASVGCFSQAFPAKYEHKQGRLFEVNKDTVELIGNIRFIKVDGKVYEIKRSTSIQEAQPAQDTFFRFPRGSGITYDTTSFTVPYGRLIVPGGGITPAIWRQ